MFPHLSKKEVAFKGYVLAADHQVETRAGFGRKGAGRDVARFLLGDENAVVQVALWGDAAKEWSGKIVQWLDATEDGEFPRTLFIAITLRVQTKLVAARYLQPKLGSRDFIFSPSLRAMPQDIRLETPTPDVIHIFLTLQVSKIFIFSIWMHFSGVYPCCRNERSSRPWKTVVIK